MKLLRLTAGGSRLVLARRDGSHSGFQLPERHALFDAVSDGGVLLEASYNDGLVDVWWADAKCENWPF